MLGIVAAILGITLLALPYSERGPDPCEVAGGHWISKSTGGIGFTTGGKMAYTPVTISLCISEDGRILE